MTLLDFLQNIHMVLIVLGVVGLIIGAIGTLSFSLEGDRLGITIAKRFALGFCIALSSIFLGAGLPSQPATPETPEQIQSARMKESFDQCISNQVGGQSIEVRAKCVDEVRKEEQLYVPSKP